MKVHPINIYSVSCRTYDNVPVQTKSIRNDFYHDTFFTSLNLLANYNISFSCINKSEPADSTAVSIYAVDKDGNYKKYSSIKV